jgi:hypothetical protein
MPNWGGAEGGTAWMIQGRNVLASPERLMRVHHFFSLISSCKEKKSVKAQGPLRVTFMN